MSESAGILDGDIRESLVRLKALWPHQGGVIPSRG